MNLGVNLQESWYEKLQRWEDALRAYEKRCETMMVSADEDDTISHRGGDSDDECSSELALSRSLGPSEDTEAVLGRMRCLQALSEWEQLADLAHGGWCGPGLDAAVKEELAGLGASSALMLGRWDMLGEYSEAISPETTHGTFYRAVLAVHRGDFGDGRQLIQRWGCWGNRA